MTWLVFALLTAFFESMKDLFSKIGLGQIDEYMIAWAIPAFALPVLLPALFVLEWPEIGPDLAWAVPASGLLNTLAIVLYMKAIKLSDLSLTVPLVTFTPLFLLITSPLMLGEFPKMIGLAGVILIVGGSYMLNIRQYRKGFIAPIKALLHEPGPKLMLCVAVIWSISANIDKIGVQNSSPVFWSVFLTIFLSISLLVPVLIWSTRPFSSLRSRMGRLIPIGLFNALTLISQMTAINMTLVAYVIAIKRMSTMLSVIWGHTLLGEKGFQERLLGVIIMLGGVVLVSMS